MSLNCSSGLFFIPNFLIIKGCNLRFCCRRTDRWQFNSFQKEKTKRLSSPKTAEANILTRFVFFLPRRCWYISNVCGLLFVISVQQFLNVVFSFLKTSQKKKEKQRGRFGLVIGQKRRHPRIKIRLVTLVSKWRRLVYLLFSSNVVQVPHVRSTVISTFPFEKVFPYY